jgi:RNA polymerase sigma-70 factor (ECF subfamily)
MHDEPRYLEIERLLHLAHGGDREALGVLLELYRRHTSLLARTQIDPLLRVKVDESDLAQDTCLEAHRHFSQFRGTTEAEFAAWMRKILAGLLANSIRRYRGTKQRDLRRERPASSGLGESTMECAVELVSQEGTPSEQAVERETSLQLAMAIEQLAPDYRRVIDLRNLEGLSFAEVSEKMGRSVDSVEKLWSRAVGKLRRVLQFSNYGVPLRRQAQPRQSDLRSD